MSSRQVFIPGPINCSKTLLWGSHKNPGGTAIRGRGDLRGSTHPSFPGTFQVLKLKVSCPRTLLSSGQAGTVNHSTVMGGMVPLAVLEGQSDKHLCHVSGSQGVGKSEFLSTDGESENYEPPRERGGI